MFEQIAQSIPYQHISVGGINISIKRLDLVHPYISGNKFFKLKYNLLTAQKQGYKKLLTFGGAYSPIILPRRLMQRSYLDLKV